MLQQRLYVACWLVLASAGCGIGPEAKQQIVTKIVGEWEQTESLLSMGKGGVWTFRADGTGSMYYQHPFTFDVLSSTKLVIRTDKGDTEYQYEITDDSLTLSQYDGTGVKHRHYKFRKLKKA